MNASYIVQDMYYTPQANYSKQNVGQRVKAEKAKLSPIY